MQACISHRVHFAFMQDLGKSVFLFFTLLFVLYFTSRIHGQFGEILDFVSGVKALSHTIPDLE